MLNLPAHTTHLLQVADISVFGPFKKYLATATALAAHQRNGFVKPQHVAALTKPAWEKATSRENIIKGFEKAGIVPFNREKITAKIYKQGSRLRNYTDDSARFAVPPEPPLPPIVLDSSSCSAVVPISSPPVIETVTSILAPPAPLPLQPPTKRKHNGINTTYAVMLSQQSIVDTLRERKEQKEQKENAKSEKKRKKDEKKKANSQKVTPPRKKRKTHSVRVPSRLSNKENVPPTRTNSDFDPYDDKHE